MKATLKRSFVFLLAAALVFGFGLIPAKNAQAAETPQTQTVTGGETLAVKDFNSGAEIVYASTAPAGSQFTFTMPQNGTMVLTCAADSNAYLYSSSFTVCNASGATISETNYTTTTEAYTDQSGSYRQYTKYYNLAKGNYILKAANPPATGTILELQYVPAGTTLKSGKTTFGGSKTATSVSYYKIKVNKAGLLKVNVQDAAGISSFPSYQVRLMNAKKKGITKFETVGANQGYATCYGVKKGTYYIAVKSTASSPAYGITATAKKISIAKSGKKKSKAVSIKRGKTINGVIYAANKKTPGTCWYKIKLTKDQKFTLTFKCQSSSPADKGKLKVTFMNSNGSKKSDSFYYYYPGDKIKYYTLGNNGKLRKGTYWICVSGENYGNGSYSLKWK